MKCDRVTISLKIVGRKGYREGNKPVEIELDLDGVRSLEWHLRELQKKLTPQP